MHLKSGFLCLRRMRFYAFHGVLPQERQTGGYFLVNLRVGYPLEAAMLSDRIDDTLNYAALYALVDREMKQPSSLLEHVAGRIVKAIEEAFPLVSSIDMELTKENPPMGADCDGATVEMHWGR